MGKDNSGFSLVELLVAMAIITVMGSMLFIGMGIIPRTAAKSCANSLKAAIGQTRIMTMGKKETIFVLKRDTDGKYYTFEKYDDGNGTFVESTPELCGKSTVIVSYHLESTGTDPLTDTNYYQMAEGDSMTLSFDRGSGKLLQGGAVGSNGLCDAIKVEGGGATYTIRIYTATGKITLDN